MPGPGGIPLPWETVKSQWERWFEEQVPQERRAGEWNPSTIYRQAMGLTTPSLSPWQETVKGWGPLFERLYGITGGFGGVPRLLGEGYERPATYEQYMGRFRPTAPVMAEGREVTPAGLPTAPYREAAETLRSMRELTPEERIAGGLTYGGGKGARPLSELSGLLFAALRPILGVESAAIIAENSINLLQARAARGLEVEQAPGYAGKPGAEQTRAEAEAIDYIINYYNLQRRGF